MYIQTLKSICYLFFSINEVQRGGNKSATQETFLNGEPYTKYMYILNNNNC